MSLLRRIRAAHAIAVQLSGSDLGQIEVPDLVGLFPQGDTRHLLRRVWLVEETQLHAYGIFGEERKIDARAVPRGAERIRLSWPSFHISSSRSVTASLPQTRRQRNRVR